MSPFAKVLIECANPPTKAQGFIEVMTGGNQIFVPYRFDQPSIDGGSLHLWMGIKAASEEPFSALVRDLFLLRAIEVATRTLPVISCTHSLGNPPGMEAHNLLRK